MKLQIYRQGSVIAEPFINSQTKFTQSLMAEHKIDAVLASPAPMSIQMGDYIIWKGVQYTINKPEIPVEKSASQHFLYSVSFEAPIYTLTRKRFKSTLNEKTFDYFGKPLKHLQLLLSNINSIDNAWSLGDIDDLPEQTINFDSIDCRQALTQIAEAFKLEYHVLGKTIHLKKQIGNPTILSFEYGQSKGLYKLSRKAVDDTKLVTRLWGYGGTQNIDYNYHNGAKQVQFDGGYIEKNVDIHGIIEDDYSNEDIFPHRDGTVTAIDASNALIIIDSSIDFDINDLKMGNTDVSITFNTGQLAGSTFTLSNYDAATKKITFNELTEDNDYKLPNDARKPAVGDTYVLTGLKMPASYITAAEAELLADTQAYLNKYSQILAAYDVTLSKLYLRRNNIDFGAGDQVHIMDNDLGIDADIRVTSITYPLLDEFAKEIVISDDVLYNRETSQLKTNADTKRAIAQVDISRAIDARRGAANQKLLKDAIYDPDGKFDMNSNVRAGSISALMLEIGTVSQNFRLPGSSFYLLANNTTLNITAAQLIHASLEIEGLGFIWNIPAATLSMPDTSKVYYLYAKCSKTALTGVYIADTVQHKTDEETGYFWFLIGSYYAVNVNGYRGMDIMYGYTSINGGTIITGRIKDLSGNTWFDLDTGEIHGKITFSAGSSGYNNLTDKPDLTPFEDTTDYVNNTLPDVLTGLQNQIDGQIESWFYADVPTLSNLPASDWNTDDKKDAHLGDLYYNQTDGKGYRFSKTGSVYSWTLLADTDIALALTKADAAQDTADHKRRVFVAQPTTPYDMGDLWVQGTSGDIMRCQTARQSGAYQSGDWVKASKYTDDTVANAKNKIFVSATAPTALSAGDLWIDTSNGNLVKCWSGSAWTAYQDAGISAAYELAGTKNKTFTGSSAPTGMTEGDIWLDSGHGNVINRYNGTAWVAMKDADISTALTNAANAQSTADKAKAKTDFINDTTIDSNLVATGTLLVGDASGANAGISGVTDGASTWRFWAGADFAMRANAPFRVDNDGSMFATKGVVGGFTLAENSLTASANDTTLQFESLGNGSGYFRVNQAGDAICSIRTDEARNALRLYTQGAGGVSLYINGQAGATAINSYGGHNLVSRSGEAWSAPGVLGAMNIQYNGGSTSPTTIDSWGITGLGFGISWPGTAGRYRWTHNLGHTDYMLVCNISTQDGTSQIISTYSKSANYVDFTFYTVVNNSYANLLLIGRNIQA